MPASWSSGNVLSAAPVILLIFSTRGCDASGNQPHSSALPLPVSSGQPVTLPRGDALNELVESVASLDVGDDIGSPEPPAMNSVSSVEPAVFAEKPMPKRSSPCCVVHVVAVQAALVVSTWNSLPSLNSTHATALRSMPIENGAPPNRPPPSPGQLSVPMSMNVLVMGSNFDSVLFAATA